MKIKLTPGTLTSRPKFFRFKRKQKQKHRNPKKHSGKMKADFEIPKHTAGLFSVWDFFRH